MKEALSTMESVECVSYIRVSTQRQHQSGLGEADQREAVANYIKADKRRKPGPEFAEQESGRNNNRPVIQKAIAYCKARKARLVIAKLDRLARNVKFIAELMDDSDKHKPKVDFVALDLPDDVDPLNMHIHAAFAEHEARRIAERIKAALKHSKKKLGGPRYLLSEKTGKPTKKLWDLGSVQPLAVAARQRNVAERNAPLITTVKALRHDKMTLAEIGAELEGMGKHPPRGGQWHASQIARLLATKERTVKPAKKKR